MIKVKRALISVSDKKGLIPFARGLHKLDVGIISTGGTARQIKEAGIPVTEVSDYTGFPEMLDGRVKSLHPKIHGGILADRDNKDHKETLKKNKIGMIDMVVINLYPFESVISKRNVSMRDAVENIDIGGPALIRSAAKNFKSVAAICDPKRYQDVLKELETNNGLLSDSVLFQLAVEAFRHTSHYDNVISDFLSRRLRGEEEFTHLPREVIFRYTKAKELRYGENPHQRGAFYRSEHGTVDGVARWHQLHGKELSFNNYLDLNAALDFIKGSPEPAAVIIKHGNPTGIAEDKSLAGAYKRAHACDSESAFGGIIGLNKPVDYTTAKRIIDSGFMECVIAPGFQPKALNVLTKKKNLRLLEINFSTLKPEEFDIKQVVGGILLQEKDAKDLQPSECKVVTKKKPTKAQMGSLMFGWRMIRNVKSNAILLVKGSKTVGIGCGQTSRVESVRVAISKSGKNAKGAVMVSDGFFPMTDNIKLAAKAGIKAVIQPGGSIADADVIKAADKAGIAMVMTGCRHFKH